MSKPIRKFIKEHRDEIDTYIKEQVPNAKYFNDEERRNWILNDEALYNWARSERVNI